MPSRVIRQQAPGFNPRQLFTAMQGAWYEPRLGAMWQENTGLTATMAAGQTIGLILDQSQNAARGPELVTNGNFDTDVTGWSLRAGSDPTTGGQLTWVNGAAQFARGTTFPSSAATQLINSFVVGKTYLISGSARMISGTGICGIQLRTSDGGGGADLSAFAYTASTSWTALSLVWIATQTSGYISLRGGDNLSTAQYDNISVREIAGNHAIQATVANRPTYRLDVNNLPLVRHDSNDVLTASLPNLGGGVFSAAGSVYFATPQGMSARHNQSMGATYNIPALNTDLYGMVILPSRLPPPVEQQLALYMQRLVGLADGDFFWQDDTVGQFFADDGETILLRG